MMNLTDILGGINFALVLLFGVALSVSFAGGCKVRRDWVVLFALCPVFLALQAVFWLMLGLEGAKRFYPLYIHLPLLLVMIFGLKKPAGISLVSICTGYLCCQLPRCGSIMTAAVTRSALTGEIVYTLIIVLVFFLLWRYFAPSVQGTMEESPRSLLLFGTLPVLYYICGYTVTLGSDLLSTEPLSSDHAYSGLQIAVQILPTLVGLLYMIYTIAYRQQLQQRTQAELLSFQMAGQLKQAETEMASLRRAEAQTAAYQHDMRHHLTAIDGFLAAGSPQQAQEYIKKVRTDIEVIAPKRFCENKLVNLLCSSFSVKAERMGARLKVVAAVPALPPVSDTELCSLLSNGLENALNAVGELEENRRWVEFYCVIRLGQLLIEIRNPYAGQIPFRDGLPAAAQQNHGHGCRSIQTITQTHQGLCDFSAEGGIFTLRVALPM